MKPTIATLTHPDYDVHVADWKKYRLTAAGGGAFIDKYLKQFSQRESWIDFEQRKAMTYCPAYAKAALREIISGISLRVRDIQRRGGTNSYQQAIDGASSGVDLNGHSMNNFIANFVLPDLLAVGKIGVYIDRPVITPNESRAQTANANPYIYTYVAEDIRSWSYDTNMQLTSLLLRDTAEEIDETTGLTTGTKTIFRLLQKDAEGIQVTFYNHTGDPIEGTTFLDLKEIPFVIFELSQSLLTDVSNHQIALLNLASSDMNYALKGNFPFYTEQFDSISEMASSRIAHAQVGVDGEIVGSDGTSTAANTASNPEIRVGVAAGRRYGKGLDRPSFIAPSAEPLKASMEKQERIQKEIRVLINLTIANLTPVRASAESKKEDRYGLEAGLSCIGLELEYGENQISKIWAMYEGASEVATIKYPPSFTVKSEEERNKEAESIRKGMLTIASMTYRREMAKRIINLELGHLLDRRELETIEKEINEAVIPYSDPDDLREDIEAGLLTVATGSRAKLYGSTEAESAKQEHAERLARIQKAQTAPVKRDTDE